MAFRNKEDIINDKFKVYSDIQSEFIPIIFHPFLHSFFSCNAKLELAISALKVDQKEQIKEFKPNPNILEVKKIFLTEVEKASRLLNKENQSLYRKELCMLIADYFIKGILETISKTKTVILQN